MGLSWEKSLYSKKIFITGATGLIGAALIKELIRLNDKENLNLHILALIRSDEKARSVFGEDYNSDILKFIVGGGGATS